MPALLIPIHNLDSVGKDFVFALDEAWLRGAFADTGVQGDVSAPGEVSVHAQRNGSEILVHGRAHARLITECGRCLGPVPVDVACDLAALYAPQVGAPRPDAEEDEEDLDIDPDAPDREFYTGEQVAIDDLVRDYLLLELPMQPRCEPECELPLGVKGGTQELGEEIDPRLQPLLKLAQGERERDKKKE
ncbi:MAG TPA: DUF177 domain-containing protein [Polyangiales bacterium]